MGAPTAVVGGTIAATPDQGGATWAVLQFLLGLRRLGWDVWFVEPIAAASTKPRGVAYLARVAERVGLENRWAIIDDDAQVFGEATALDALGAADLVLDISGLLLRSPTTRDVASAVPTRVFLDLDPGFVQFWIDDGVDLALGAHTHHATLADTIGTPASPIPDLGERWIPTLPPIVLEHWPVDQRAVEPALTTIGHWRSYGAVHRGETRFGLKAHAYRALAELPTRAEIPVRPALAVHQDECDDLEMLSANRWQLIDPAHVAGDPDRYAEFVRSSWAELAIAKEGYIVADTGWFSDRSACYLASGRPVIASDTGFARRLPSGRGLLPFVDLDGALDAIAAVHGDYPAHRAAARAIAEEHLDADRVLPQLLGALG